MYFLAAPLGDHLPKIPTYQSGMPLELVGHKSLVISGEKFNVSTVKAPDDLDILEQRVLFKIDEEQICSFPSK